MHQVRLWRQDFGVLKSLCTRVGRGVKLQVEIGPLCTRFGLGVRPPGFRIEIGLPCTRFCLGLRSSCRSGPLWPIRLGRSGPLWPIKSTWLRSTWPSDFVINSGDAKLSHRINFTSGLFSIQTRLTLCMDMHRLTLVYIYIYGSVPLTGALS